MTYPQQLCTMLEESNRPMNLSEITEYLMVTCPQRQVDIYGNTLRTILCKLKTDKLIAYTKFPKYGGYYYLPTWKVEGEKVNGYILDKLRKKFVPCTK